MKYLPLKQAIRLPIFIYPRTIFKMKKGAKIYFSESMNNTGSIKLGQIEKLFNQRKEYSYIVNGGELQFGTNITVASGICCTITKSGKLHLNNNVKLGANNKLVCCKEIIIGEHCRFAFDCQIFDTGFHYIKNLNDNTTNSISKGISINQYCWIGNRTTINQGTILPAQTIVGTNSLLNKDYTNLIQENSIIAGQPAKLIRSGVQRIWDINIEIELLIRDGLYW